MPRVSIVIVNWNGGDVVVRCVRSLAEHPPTVPWEAILVDNGSTDGSAELARAELPELRVIANPRNRGLAAGNNQGMAASTAPFVVLSNPDIIYRPGSVDALLALMERRERAAFGFLRLEDPDGQLQVSVGDLPRLREALLGRRLLLRRDVGRPTGMWWPDWPHDTEQRVGHGIEACYIVRRDAVAEIGLQDERMRLDWEGIDWAARARDRGWEAWFCAAAVTHLGGQTLRKAPYRWIVSSHKGMYLYFAERLPRAASPALAAAIAGRAAVKLLVTAGGARFYEGGHRGRH